MNTLLETMRKFEEQRKDLKLCVGVTVTQEAWDRILSKFEDREAPMSEWRMDGLPLFLCTKQTSPMIGWYNEDRMKAFIAVDGDVELREEENGVETRPVQRSGIHDEAQGLDDGQDLDGISFKRVP